MNFRPAITVPEKMCPTKTEPISTSSGFSPTRPDLNSPSNNDQGATGRGGVLTNGSGGAVDGLGGAIDGMGGATDGMGRANNAPGGGASSGLPISMGGVSGGASSCGPGSSLGSSPTTSEMFSSCELVSISPGSASDSELVEESGHFFEGVEKLLEVWFKNSSDDASSATGRRGLLAKEKKMMVTSGGRGEGGTTNNACYEGNKCDLRKIPR